MNAPAAPVAMLGDRGQRAGFGRGGRSGFAPQTSAADSNEKENENKPTLDPARYKPRPGFTDQPFIGNRGTKAKWALCMRCGQAKGQLHPAFADCREVCDICETNKHFGEVCGLIFASGKWWGEHVGHVPERVQI